MKDINPFKVGDFVFRKELNRDNLWVVDLVDGLTVRITTPGVFDHKISRGFSYENHNDVRRASVVELCLARNRLDEIINVVVKKNSE